MKRPTIADIARRVGVSQGAVSYALNGRPGVSEATRVRVLKVAEELGWRPSVAARALTGASAGAVGLVLSRPPSVLGAEPFFMELFSGIETTLKPHSCALMLQMADDQDAEIEVYRRWWAEGRIDGAILVEVHVDDRRLPVLESLGMPAVVIGGLPGGAGSLPSVRSDESVPVHETVEYLAALGHRRFGRVAGLPHLVHTRVRDEAFAEACARLGLSDPVTLHTDYTGEEGARATRRLLSSSSRPTAIIYDNDIMAVAGLSVAQEMRLRVPDDLSLVAWDDSQLAQVVRPALTAVRRDVPALGAAAARHLLSLINGETLDDVETEPARLTPRGSTGALV
ncbi:DNA-binding LacI/PurR family transcriptional regulator [Thermocatellispora tengchongensis]|uniref:DNA-binding LacI/PurR family transcriptional regulator n=1 Tax=Thermocatellispora tengchongensis TaxID=1073253 RepID=A0A840PMR0_9ACTN|nr:LacI family DNA-binding transcriptional regulator [Thermocatellispora tengchongensis]MBB5140229.1 DNA-binding LacI/PurR family transcriptional regulator [Thermocatellispora tengchongensis]